LLDEGMASQAVRIPSAGGFAIGAQFQLPRRPGGVVVMADGGGSVADALAELEFATLALDVVVDEEDSHDIGLLARRVLDAIDWARRQASLEQIPAALIGRGISAAAALVAASERLEVVHAVISHDGRPDLAGESLERVEAATLLIVGDEAGKPLLEMNRHAMHRMRAHVELETASAAQVAELAAEWCQRYLWSMA
jgi:putative phosphoribosyl transferase